MTKCYSCGLDLEPVGGFKTNYQFDNSLWLGFHGGYGMFIDPMVRTPVLGANEEAVICHDCAHELCAKVPWIEKLLDSYSSHSHTDEYHIDNLDHYGWDYDN